MYKFLLIVLNFFLIFNVYSSSESNEKKILDYISNNNLSQAMELIEQGLKKSATDVSHMELKSRVQTLMGDKVKDEDKKVEFYEKAQDTASKLIEVHPKSAKGYNRRAVAKGKQILFKGILQSRALVLELREDAKKTLSLSGVSNYDKALANYLLGRAHIKLAKKPRALRMPLGLAWASNKKGGEFLKKAVELSPDIVSFNLSYSEYLIDKEKTSEAKVLLEKIKSLKNNDPADAERKAKAIELLKNL